MDTNRLKRFAIEARNILMQGVAHRFTALGFLPDGTVTEEPQPLGGGATFMGDTVSEDFYQKWCSLQRAVNNHSIEEVAEEAAYTWFNRMVAIRIMVKNGLIAPVLQYESDGVHIPLLVSEARQGRIPEMTVDDKRKLEDLLLDDSKTDEQFRILLVAFCHTNPVINSCFGHISDYTELLLPTNILAEGGFVDMLNNTEFISEEDYHSPELIGWLYQFYISEKKDYIINSGKKAEVKDIPARTQLFTPNWIVRYMVQNTIGRIYLDNNPYSEIKKDLEFYIPSEEPTPDVAVFHFDDLHDFTCADLGCGSGHILNECFDLFYRFYIEEGYSRRMAIEDIFRYNLLGIDIDTRAKQLAQFALLLKACQKDISFSDGHILPKILDMPEPYPYKKNLLETLHILLPNSKERNLQEICYCIDLMDHAKNIGSIMDFNLSKDTRDIIDNLTKKLEGQDLDSQEFEELSIRLRIVLALTEKYASIVMNPPYMGSSYMNSNLKNYVAKTYPNGKADLFSAFMYKSSTLLKDNGAIGYVCPFVWMFISTYESFRYDILNSYNITSLIQLEYNAFEPACVPIGTFTMVKTKERYSGSYIKLSDFKGHQNQAPKTLEAINDNKCGWFYYKNQNDYISIPGLPIAYWVSKKTINLLTNSEKVGDRATTKQGCATGDNNRFLRVWHEVSNNKIGFKYSKLNDAIFSGKKWFPINKGGDFRRWYGNQDYVIAFDRDNYEALSNMGNHLPSKQYYFQEHIAWNMLTSSNVSFRYFPKGFVFNNAANACFTRNVESVLGLFNSKFISYISKVMNPTLNLPNGVVNNFPYIPINEDDYKSIVRNNVLICKLDWDSHETSWDFETHPLLKYSGGEITEEGESANLGKIPDSVEELYLMYKTEWEHYFKQLHDNEEELNRQFIEIYGLQDELTPNVPLDEITILQQGEISIEDNQLKWNADVVMKQLISYAVGCMMGRYSIDKPGLILANQGDGLDQYNEQVPDSRFEPDDDGIIPLMSAQSDFADNATIRFKQWLVAAFGEKTLVENLNFIEKCLGKSIDDYFVKDFWKDHKRMYQNRPIYWLFSSKKGAFQCLTYMHRMDAYTAERIRTKYLLPHIEWLIQKQGEMEANAANLNARERKELDNIGKQIEECREYHDRLHVIADKQIAFDLDDGVVVNYAKFGDVLAKLK